MAGSICVFADKTCQKLYRTLSIKGEKTIIHSCDEALNLIKDINAEIILIDCGFKINMALKLLTKIKKRHPSIPIIILTDKSSEETAVNAFRLGAREYFKKPFNIIELQKLIKNIMKLKRSSKERRFPLPRSKDDKVNTIPIDIKRGLPINLLSVISFIEENLSERISLSDCAKIASMSKYHFCRYFKKHIGITPMNYLNLTRIMRAKKLLLEEEINMLEAGLFVGFNDYSTFTRNFKKFTGLRPKDYQKSQKKV